MAESKKEEMTIKVDKVGKFGVEVNKVWLNISQYGDASLEDFEAGKTYRIVAIHSKTGKIYIDKILDGKGSPELPKTAVEETKPSRTGNSPVAPAGTNGPAPVSAGVESLSTRDVYMAAQAAMKSALESPTVHFLATTLPEDQVPDLIRKYAELGVDIVLKIVADRRG